MKHPLLWLIALLGLLLATVFAVAAFASANQSPTFSVTAIQAELARDPQAWVDRTVRVRGAVVYTGCFVATEGVLAFCAPPRLWLTTAIPGSAPAQMPLSWETTDPLPTFLRRVPLLSRLVPGPQAILWDVVATYRVRFRALTDACSAAGYEVVVLDGQP